MHPPVSYPIGIPGQPWGPQELAQWQARQAPQRSHQDDVVRVLQGWSSRFDVWRYPAVTATFCASREESVVCAS